MTFSSHELKAMNDTSKPIITAEQTNASNLEKENARLKRELNSLRLKEVERQQTEFGVGIND